MRRGRKKAAARPKRRSLPPSTPWAPVSPYSPFIDETIAFWEPRYGRDVTREDARQIVENLTGFFSLLMEWDRAEEDKRGKGPSKAKA